MHLGIALGSKRLQWPHTMAVSAGAGALHAASAPQPKALDTTHDRVDPIPHWRYAAAWVGFAVVLTAHKVHS